VEPQPVEPQPVEPQPVEPQPVEPQPVEPQPVEPQPVEPQPVEPQPVERRPVEPQPVDTPVRVATGASPRGDSWFAVALATASPLGSAGGNAPSLGALVGDDHAQITLEYGHRVNDRDSWGAVLDFSVGGVGRSLEPVCARYGTDCSTATAQLGLFLRRDFAPLSSGNPWVSIGLAREWLNGEVFAPYGGGESVPVLSAPGWQGRLGGGLDWRASRWLGLGLYGTLALGAYDRVTIDGVDADGGTALHGWAQLGVRAIFGP
jgi:hypothetical protein